MPAIGAIAVVALHRDGLARDVHDLIGFHECKRHRHRDERLGLVVGATQPTAHQDVETA